MKRNSNEHFSPALDTGHDTDKQARNHERRRKLGKIALRSLETAFSVATLVQAGNNAVAVANELLHDHPVAVSTEDQTQNMGNAIEKTHIEYVQEQLDNLGGLEANQQERVKAQWHVSTNFSESPSLYIANPNDKS